MKQVGKICIVCEKNPGKYRCTKCPEKYCSKDCYKIHQCDEQYLKQKEQKNQAEQNQDQIEDPAFKQNYVEDDDLRVPKSVLRKLWKNKKLRETLKSEKLRKKLNLIDNAKSRLWQLNQEINTDEPFLKVIDEMLTTMELMKDNVFIGQNN